jgi:pyrroline-5-carboxylate reductase
MARRKVLFLGGGNMAQAMLKGLAGHAQASDCLVVEKDEAKRTMLAGMGVETTNVWQGSTTPVFCILAIKPQDAISVLPHLNLPADSVVCSLAAGLRIDTIAGLLPEATSTVIRVMPNLAAAGGHAVTGLFAPDQTSADVRTEAESLFSAFGQAFWLADEAMLHAVTALTGSGPGYVFYFMDSMAQAASKMGFSEAQSQAMVAELFTGAAMMAKDGQFAALVKAVASKGGTTEAALSFFQDKALPALVQEAIFRARERSQALALGDDGMQVLS